VNTTLIDLSDSFADAVERAGRSIVSVNEGGRSGVSGTVWRDGLVVTAEHTIRGLEDATIELPNGASSSATVVGRDPSTDIALLRLKNSLPAKAEFAEVAQLRVGNFVLAVGRRGKQGLTASHGIISGLGGAWRTWSGGRIDQSFRLDLLPFTGFSGGPLVDAHGKVIGMNTSGPRRSVMTVPATTVNRVVDQLLAKGRIARGFLGVGLQPVRVPSLHAPSRGSTGRGLLVIMVEPGGPAEKGGLMIGDIVVALEDKPLTDPVDLQATLDPEQVGKTVQLRILRAGQEQGVSLTVAERPE
jgi:S1-C subfamily serine protease